MMIYLLIGLVVHGVMEAGTALLSTKITDRITLSGSEIAEREDGRAGEVEE